PVNKHRLCKRIGAVSLFILFSATRAFSFSSSLAVKLFAILRSSLLFL
ncbi:hypothetical protein CP082626L3_1123B, partial [Chlamydia psittaci 08-2626_L3]